MSNEISLYNIDNEGQLPSMIDNKGATVMFLLSSPQ